VAIEFHCEHCNKLVKAPDEVAGQQGKCPHCGGVNYIRRPLKESDELELAPFDEEAEAQARRAALEAAAVQQRLLHERSVPGEPGAGRGRPSLRRGAPVTPAAPPSSKQLAALIVRYVEAMSQGRLEAADSVAGELRPHRAAVISLLDDLAGEDLAAYGMPTLPRPVLFGFLKQLRALLG
jgi:phage FluMu protein Com